MRAVGVGPLSATVNDFGSVNAAASILVAPVPALDIAAHAAASSVPRPRSAAVAMTGSAVVLHRITVAIAVHARGAARFVVIWSSHGLFLAGACRMCRTRKLPQKLSDITPRILRVARAATQETISCGINLIPPVQFVGRISLTRPARSG
jgi:hypothetical protein